MTYDEFVATILFIGCKHKITILTEGPCYQCEKSIFHIYDFKNTPRIVFNYFEEPLTYEQAVERLVHGKVKGKKGGGKWI